MTPSHIRSCQSPAGRPCSTHTMLATELGTRTALSQIRSEFAGNLPHNVCGRVEIALAEILNNIVEHAYAGTENGEVMICAWIDRSMLHLEVRDDGAPMPNLAIPRGGLQDLTVARDDLPEGGFGWMLIRTLARDLTYERNGATNILRVEFEITDE
ncbi:MAG: ATP-binding protein [Marinibacterium sp.]